MQADYSDILGHDTLPILTQPLPDSTLPSLFSPSVALILAGLIAAGFAGFRIWEVILRWRERSYKLATRRRHGIPDDDHRPFNVAYADVVSNRMGKETRKRMPQPQPAGDRVAATALPEQQARYRSTTQSVPRLLPGAYNSFSGQPDASTSSHDVKYPSIPPAIDPYAPAYQATASDSDGALPQTGAARRFTRADLEINGVFDPRKRTFDEPEDDEHDAKKTKVDGEEFIDGNEDPEWEDVNGFPAKRGSKRVLGDEDESEYVQSMRTRDKRARKVSLDKPMDVDMEGEAEQDAVPELRSVVRGKKRDRAEAGSTFGGDDESEPEHENDSKERRRRRKRRTVNGRKSDAGSTTRGKKRDRDGDEGSDMEVEDETHKLSRKKRGKRSSLAPVHGDEDQMSGGSDVSLDESLASTRSRPRRIGDEWESNGVKYKIGPNGQRLRQDLVKKARQKFLMPEDSQHPDRNANLEVYVETWLTEEAYREAKEQHLLAWQETPKKPKEPEPLAVDIPSPSPPVQVGKNLLWSVPATPSGSPLAQSPVPESPALLAVSRRGSGAHQLPRQQANPFEQGPHIPTRRITSVARAINMSPMTPGGGLSDSTNGSHRGFRIFSKLEKQDLEAKGIMAIRKKAELEAKVKQERERAERDKAERERAERERADRERVAREAAEKEKAERAEREKAERLRAENERAEKEKKAKEGASAQVPAITVTQPSAEPTRSSFSFGTTEPPKTDSGSKLSLFNAPPLGSTPSFAPPAASKPAETAGSQPSLFPAPTSSAASTQNFFAKPSAPASTSQPSNPFGAQTAGADTKKSEQPNKPLFSFGTPSGNSSTGGTKSFFAPATASKDIAQPSTSGDGGSLLSRMGGAKPPSEQQKAPSVTPQAEQTSSSFAFGKPAGDAAKPTSVFGTPSAFGTSAPQNPPAPSAEGASSGLKFNFGFSNNKPATSAPSTTSSLSGALGPNPSKSSATPASSDVKTPAETTTKPTGDTAAPSKPLFSFATSSGPTILGAKPAPATPSGQEPAKASVFGGFGTSGTSGTTTSAFGASNQTASSSPFGTSSVFGGGGASSTFGGGAAAKPAETPNKSLFGFAPSASSTTPASKPSTDAPKSNFSFGNATQPASTTPAATPTSGGTGSLFGGFKPNASTTPFGAPASSQSPFGAPSTPSATAFGFGAPTNPASSTPTTTPGATSNIFGASSSNTQQPQK